MSSDVQGQPRPRQFQSAEKPISLHPLSFKQALVALLQIGRIDLERKPGGAAARETGPDSGDG